MFDPAKRKLRLTGPIPEPVALPAPGMFRLLTPKAHYYSGGRGTRRVQIDLKSPNMPRQRRAQGRPMLAMNSADATARGFADHQELVVKNQQGRITAWLHVTEDIRPGVVALPGKWWSFPPKTGAVANVLTPSSWSPGGQPAFNDTFVEVAAV